MDDSSTVNLMIIAVLILVNHLITIAYAALNNTRQSTLRDMAEEGHAGASRVMKMLQQDVQLNLTYQISVTLIHFSIALVATVEFIAPYLVEGAIQPGIAMVMVIALVTLVLGQVVAEGIGSANSQSLVLIMVRPLRWLSIILRPLTWLLLGLSRLIASLFGSEAHVNRVTEEEIMTLVNAGLTGGTIEDEEKDMIYSVLQLDQTNARELMTPRPDIVALEVGTDLGQALNEFIDTGFSRIPIYEENIDNIVGFLYAKDLLNLWRTQPPPVDKPLRDLIRPAYFVPETKRADELLRELQNHKIHMAIVVDEYGGTSGLVTIENLIEEIVGDIMDEYDLHEEAEYIQTSENEYIVDASMDLDDFNELLDVEFDSDETDTLAGYIYMHLGHVPSIGEMVETDEIILKVRSIEGRRIRKVLVTRKIPASATSLADETKDDDGDSLADAS